MQFFPLAYPCPSVLSVAFLEPILRVSYHFRHASQSDRFALPVKVLATITYRHFPPVLRRISVRCFWVSLAVVILTIAFVIVRDIRHWPRRPWNVITPIIGGFTPACIIFPLGWWLRRGIVREWHEASGRLCTHCAYNVSTLAAAGTCPECGGEYDSQADAATWTKAGLTSPLCRACSRDGIPISSRSSRKREVAAVLRASPTRLHRSSPVSFCDLRARSVTSVYYFSDLPLPTSARP